MKKAIKELKKIIIINRKVRGEAAIDMSEFTKEQSFERKGCCFSLDGEDFSVGINQIRLEDIRTYIELLESSSYHNNSTFESCGNTHCEKISVKKTWQLYNFNFQNQLLSEG